MKTVFEVVNTNGTRFYKLSFVGGDIFLENEQEETMSMPEKDLFDIIDDYYRLVF